MTPAGRYVVATAGHVDHGKSTLVRALTGIEPDRFAEERRRGMTIDLGFAWTELPSGALLAFVDVPGHERFIANTLAGLGPAPAVLFVVAADDGWSAQSSEHLAVVDALSIQHGLLVVTRSDLADPEPTRTDAAARIARTSLGSVETVVVSGATGAGVPRLREALDRLVAALPQPDTTAPVRLWLDRSFSVHGSGTVVTGTLGSGTVRVGDTLQLGERLVTVRALQSAGTAYEELAPVTRVAVNLRGISVEAAGRGDVLLTPDAWFETAVFDARISDTGNVPARCTLHVGTAAVPARIRPLDPADRTNPTSLARHVRISLDRALPLRAGDRAVLRDPGRRTLAAAVQVLDPDPPSLRRRGAARERAAVLASHSGQHDASSEIARRGVVRRDHLYRLGVDASDTADINGWLVARTTHAAWIARAPGAVREWARTHPLDPPMPAAALADALRMPDDTVLVTVIAAQAGLQLSDGRVMTGDPRGDLGTAQHGVDTLVARLRREPFRAPEADELTALGLGRREIAAAERVGTLARIGDVVLLPDAADRALDVLRELPAPFTLSAARQALGTTRRVAVPLLEHLDALGRTRFVDENRRELTPSS